MLSWEGSTEKHPQHVHGISFSFFMARAALVSPMDVNLGLLVTQPIVMPWLKNTQNPHLRQPGAGMYLCGGMGYTVITAGWNNKLAPN